MIDKTSYLRKKHTRASHPPIAVRRSRYAAHPQVAEASPTSSEVLRFLLLHAPLLYIFRAVPFTATLHSLLVLLVGLHYLVRDERPNRLAALLGYIAGSELLWRAVNGGLIWEYGKYASLLLALLAILKYRLLGRNVFWPALFIVLLVPGIFVAPTFDRQGISFQLSGPVSLAVISMLFSAVELKKAEMQRLLLAVIGPAVSMAILVIFTAATQDVAFYGGGSNEAITGGIGANQVASLLSLGASAAFFYIFLTDTSSQIRRWMIALSTGLTLASVLTFSRAGLWNTLGALAVGAFFMLRDRRQQIRLVSIFLVLGLLVYFTLPILNAYTGGALLVRFNDFDSTGRDVLVQIDYQLFLDNPALGIGVGQSPYYHIPAFGYAKPTHTEYGRLLAEHGSLGVMILILLVVVPMSWAFSSRQPVSKGISIGFAAWALLYMTHAATRMVAPSFAFGLAAARLAVDETQDSKI